MKIERVLELGSRVEGLSFRLQGTVWCLGFWRLGLRVSCPGLRGVGLEFQVLEFGVRDFRVWGLGFRVQGFVFRFCI
jgi:hypothetical protein